MKDTLQLYDQLLCVNYAGPPSDEFGDQSLNLHDNDIANYNEYRLEVSKYYDSYRTVEGNYHSDTSDLYVDKPFMHSEYGMGEDKIYECDKNSTFLKRAILTPFTGMAGTALTWDHPENEFDNWHYLQGINDFTGEVPLDADDYKVQYPIVTNDNAVEVFYLRNYSEDGYRAIGVISNRTYNFYTQRINDSCTCANSARPEFIDPSTSLYKTPQNFIGADYDDDMVLPEMGVLKHYKIHWFNAVTNNPIFNESRWSNTIGELPIEFPELTGDSIQPLVYFQVYPHGDTSFLAPYYSNELTIENAEIDKMIEEDVTLTAVTETNWDKVQPQIQIFPNPTLSFITINIQNQDLNGTNWIIRDGLGRIVRTGSVDSSNFQIDLSVLKNGTYFLTFENLNHVYKVVKH